jgi:hypothetical protein
MAALPLPPGSKRLANRGSARSQRTSNKRAGPASSEYCFAMTKQKSAGGRSALSRVVRCGRLGGQGMRFRYRQPGHPPSWSLDPSCVVGFRGRARRLMAVAVRRRSLPAWLFLWLTREVEPMRARLCVQMRARVARPTGRV